VVLRGLGEDSGENGLSATQLLSVHSWACVSLTHTLPTTSYLGFFCTRAPPGCV